MALVTKDQWDESESHPAMQTRIDQAISLMAPWRTREADTIAGAAFEALRTRWPSVPNPVRALDRWTAAARDAT